MSVRGQRGPVSRSWLPISLDNSRAAHEAAGGIEGLVGGSIPPTGTKERRSPCSFVNPSIN